MSVTGAQFWTIAIHKTTGLPYEGLRLYHYEPGSTTDRTAWSDEAKASTAAQPIVGDAKGRISGYFEGNYRILIKTSVADGDLTLYDYDPIKFDAKAATLRAENQGSSYPAAVASNLGQIFAKTAGSAITEVGINTGSSFAALQFQGVAVTTTQSWAKGADLASASTLTLGNDGNYFVVTGTTGISAFSSKSAGIIIALRFSGVLTLTHNATNLILANGQNYTTASGDVLTFISEGSGNWREITRLMRTIKNLTLSTPTIDSISGNVIATQLNMEAGTATDLIVTPGRQHFHPGHPKAWISYNFPAGAPTFQLGYNFSTTITDNGTGDATLTFTTAMSGATYCVTGTAETTAANSGTATPHTRTTTQVRIVSREGATATDLPTCVAIFGDI